MSHVYVVCPVSVIQPSDFHPNFEGLKNGLVFCMNMNQLPSYSQLTSVCDLIGIKVQNVASIPELNDQLATSKQIRALALFVFDNTTHLANAIPCSVPSINRIAELVQVIKAKLPKPKEGKDVAIEIDRKPPILTAGQPSKHRDNRRTAATIVCLCR